MKHLCPQQVIAIVRKACQDSDCVSRMADFLGVREVSALDVVASVEGRVLRQVASILAAQGFSVQCFEHTLHATSYLRSYHPQFHSIELDGVHFGLKGGVGLNALMDGQRHRFGQDRITTQRLESTQLALEPPLLGLPYLSDLFDAIQAGLASADARLMERATPLPAARRVVARP